MQARTEAGAGFFYQNMKNFILHRINCAILFLKKVTDKHGVHFAQEMSGNVSIREIFRYAKPCQDEIQSTIEELFR